MSQFVITVGKSRDPTGITCKLTQSDFLNYLTGEYGLGV